MKITYLKLINFAGVYAGMDRTEIEIDFTKNHLGEDVESNNIVMLFGANGSGKSTILSTLTPFKDSNNDERKDLIIEGKDGYKEIHIQDGEDLYEIEHHYKSSNKCFIKKNGVELNENGGVRSFEDLVSEHLNVDTEFFKLSRIGSNVTNFIDLKTAQRKKFMGNFLPNIDEFLQKYSIVNTKYLAHKKQIKYVADQLDKIEDREVLNNRLESTQERINIKQRNIESTNATINKKRGKVSNLDPDNNIDMRVLELKKEFSTAMKEYKKMKTTIDEYLESYPSLKEYDIKRMNKGIANAQSKIESLNEKVKDLKSTVDSKRVEVNNKSKAIKSKEVQLSKYDSDVTIDKINTTIGNKKKELMSYKDALEETEITNCNFTETELKTMEVSIGLLEEAINNVIYGINTQEKTIFDTVINGDNDISDLENMLTTLNTDINTINDKVQDVNDEINYLTKNFHEQSSILSKRPELCTIDDCGFIKNALKFENAEEDIKKLNVKKDEYKKELKELEYQKDTIENVVRHANSTVNVYDKHFSGNTSTLLKDRSIANQDDFISLIDGTKKELDELFDISDEIKFVKLNDNIELLEDKITSLEEKRKNILNNQEVIEMIKKDIETLNDEKKVLNDFIDTKMESMPKLKNDISDNESKLNILETLLESTTNVDEAKKEMDSAEKKYTELLEKSTTVDTINDEIDELDKDVKRLEKELTPLDESLDSIKYSINRLNDYEKRKLDLDDNFKFDELVKDSLDPKKGIPLHFIGDYLVDIQDSANQLLDISQDGRFRILFDIDDKNFYIHVYKDNGDVLEDINIASQGETALTTVSISLAMIKKATTKYNILYLDEIDGPLDTKNRRSFITMIEKQMNELNSEQTFIISHNQEFFSQPIDMILLRDSGVDIEDEDFMSDKNVLFSVS